MKFLKNSHIWKLSLNLETPWKYKWTHFTASFCIFSAFFGLPATVHTVKKHFFDKKNISIDLMLRKDVAHCVMQKDTKECKFWAVHILRLNFLFLCIIKFYRSYGHFSNKQLLWHPVQNIFYPRNSANSHQSPSPHFG